VAARATFSNVSRLRLLNLFSGPYSRANGLASKLLNRGWLDVTQIDNDGEKGGGWAHDLLNDALYAQLLAAAHAGKFDALMIAFPCSTFSITRFFNASNANGGDAGPPIIPRDHQSFAILTALTVCPRTSSTRSTSPSCGSPTSSESAW
jgi:hypothetical protein